MIRATWKYRKLVFRKPAGTSRGVLLHKDSWFIFIFDDENPEIVGIGECGIIPGLSIDPLKTFEQELGTLCSSINSHEDWIANSGSLFPSIKFALKTAILDLNSGGQRIFQQNHFTSGINGIPINGLIWMGCKEEMKQQVKERVAQGFGCLKLKVGAHDFDHEIEVLRFVRQEFKSDWIELRLDANGAFEPEKILEKLKILSDFDIHSIEQPIKQGQVEQMAQLCSQSPIPIALDEELIGVADKHQRKLLLETIKPSFVVLKPSLLGGLHDADEWINIASKLGIGWWATSALESNIGLNAIAQWISQKDVAAIQGLGTGQLFTNNFKSPLTVHAAQLYFRPDLKWEINF